MKLQICVGSLLLVLKESGNDWKTRRPTSQWSKIVFNLIYLVNKNMASVESTLSILKLVRKWKYLFKSTNLFIYRWYWDLFSSLLVFQTFQWNGQNTNKAARWIIYIQFLQILRDTRGSAPIYSQCKYIV